MKTPKRTYTPNFLEYGGEYYGIHSQRKKETFSRWKRKNKIRQYKLTIARLSRENKVLHIENKVLHTEIIRLILRK